MAEKRNLKEGQDLGTNSDAAFAEAMLGPEDVAPREAIEAIRRFAIERGMTPEAAARLR